MNSKSRQAEAPPQQIRGGFGAQVAHTARLWRRAVDHRMRPFGLTQATWLPLLRVARAPAPMRQKDLAASLSLDGSSVVRLLDALQAAGLIERRESNRDRRAKAIVLTPLGRETVAKVESAAQQVRDDALAGVSDDELATAARLLDHICRALAPHVEDLGAVNCHVERAAHDEISGRRRHVPLWMLAMFAFSGTLGMHIFVPALPIAATDLHASPGALQLTISLYIAGLAIGQLVYGPVSDRFGRRPTLIGGLVLFTVSGLAALLAQSVDGLIVARLFQALGGCAGLVLARAIVRDTAAAHEATQRLAVMNLMVTVGPGVAPLVGGLLAGLYGWRAIFVALFALGVVNALCAWRLLPETSAKLASVGAEEVVCNYRRLLASPVFVGYAIGGGCATTSLYAFVAAAPFILVDQLHRPEREVGLYLALLVSGVWLGSVLTSRLIAKFSLRRFLVAANALSVAAAFALLAVVLTGRLSLAPLVGLMLLYNVGVGCASPAALVQAISVDRRAVGSASGLYGFAQMAVGAALTALAGLGRDPALAAATVLALAGVIAQVSFWVAIRSEARDPTVG